MADQEKKFTELVHLGSRATFGLNYTSDLGYLRLSRAEHVDRSEELDPLIIRDVRRGHTRGVKFFGVREKGVRIDHLPISDKLRKNLNFALIQLGIKINPPAS